MQCRTAYINESLVTRKAIPNDYDVCWEEAGIDPMILDPVLLIFDPGRATQKAKYMGEFFPASVTADADGLSFFGVLPDRQGNRKSQRYCGHGLGRPRMIKNERQYRVTKNQVERFSQTLAHLRRQPAEATDVHPLIAKAQEDALQSQLADLEEQLQEYEALKAGHFDLDALNAVAELPTILIKARIAQGLRQKDLAERLDLKEQQIQRYEATDYATASLTRIKEIANVLGAQAGMPLQTTSSR